MFKNTGVLFETDILQVGIKSEFKDGKGKYKINIVVLIMINEETQLATTIFGGAFKIKKK